MPRGEAPHAIPLEVIAVALVGCLALACGKSTKAPPPPMPPAADSAPPPAAQPPTPKLVDLLHFTPSVVAVSSKVDNPKDFPEHLVDGKTETAWNGKTGDLVGGWMAFRVPADAIVRRIALTAGFDKKSGDKDLFEMNVRITRVRVMRDGKLVTHATLDPKRRDMQTIDVGSVPGGDFRIEVDEVFPGTRADYKELCISELSVLGTSGRQRSEHVVLPRVHVGSLDGDVTPPQKKLPPPPSGPLGPGPYPTPEAFCDAQKKAAAPELFRKWGNAERYPGEIEPRCTIEKLDVSPKLAPPFIAAIGFVANEPDHGVGGVLLRTKEGWHPTTWERWTHDHDDPGCMHGNELKLLELSSPDPNLPLVWMRMLTADSYWMQMKPSPTGGDSMGFESWTTWDETLHVCRLTPSGALACDKKVSLASARSDEGSPDTPRRTPPFESRRKPVVGEAGTVQLVAQ